jgi:putative redox protein
VARKKVYVQSLPDYVHAQLLTTAGQAIVADEPGSVGGNDLGPDPYDLLTWALGACTSMTLQIYARRRGYPLHEVAIEVEHDHVHVRDGERAEGDPRAFVETFWRRIVLRGPLTDEQRDDLLRVARRCPVHKTLASAPDIVDSVEVVA